MHSKGFHHRMNKLSQKSFRIVRIRPYSSEGGCIVYADVPDGIWDAAEPGEPEDLRNDLDSCWEEILDHCQEIRGCIYPVLVLSADGRRLLRVRGLDGELFLPEGVEEVADYAVANKCNDGIEDEHNNSISRIVWNGSIRRIGKEAFASAVTNLLALPPTVEFVGEDPFSGNSIVRCDYIVSCQCHCADTSHVWHYKDYRRLLDDMAWIEHVCNCYGSVDEFVRNIHGIFENIVDDIGNHSMCILEDVIKLPGVKAFLSSYWTLRRLKEADGWPFFRILRCLEAVGELPQLEEVSESPWLDSNLWKRGKREAASPLCENYYMLLLEDETRSRKEKLDMVRMIMLGFHYGLKRAFPLYPLHCFHEDRGYQHPDYKNHDFVKYHCSWTNWHRMGHDEEILDAINKDAKARFIMRLTVCGTSIGKVIMAHLFQMKALSCIAAVYKYYPKTEKRFPLNDLLLAAILNWPFESILNLIDAIEREMPGRISKVKDALGNNALWYLMMTQPGPYYTREGRFRFGYWLGISNEKIAKRLVELGVDPFETTPTGLSWYEIAFGEDDTRNEVVINPRIAFLSMLRKRMMDMGKSQDFP